MREIARIGRTAQRGPEPADVVARVAGGDQDAFAARCDEISLPVHGPVLKAPRDPSRSEEGAREALVEVWRTAARLRSGRGSVMTGMMTTAHRRAVDRARSEQVGEEARVRPQGEHVRRCRRILTELQRRAVTLASYQGCPHREVAAAPTAPLGTVGTRLRDGLIRLPDRRGVNA
ncbi:RNA polymerase subunit sigma [Streptomyces enissocaesilis]|uniref:Sigma-70 family RNA polymerase sigma factor n=1 Tax=Streptomyces enissocaesilis TaxID=332589 RepID=A0ABP6JS49_9ACTN